MIKKLTQEELKALKKKKLGKKHPVHVAIEMLEPKEAIQISREAFTWKNLTPKIFCNKLSKETSKRFEVSELLNHQGWVVERVDDGDE